MALIYSYGEAKAVTPSDTTAVDYKALYIGGAGNLTVITAGGDTVTFSNLPAGSIIPVHAVKIMAATTATLILGLN